MSTEYSVIGRKPSFATMAKRVKDLGFQAFVVDEADNSIPTTLDKFVQSFAVYDGINYVWLYFNENKQTLAGAKTWGTNSGDTILRQLGRFYCCDHQYYL